MKKRAYNIGDLVWYVDFKAPVGDEYVSRTIIVGIEEVEKRVWKSSPSSKLLYSEPFSIEEDAPFIPVRDADHSDQSYRLEKYRYYRIMAGEQITTVGEYEVWKHKKRLVNSISYRLNRQIQKSFSAYKPVNYNQIMFPQIGGIVTANTMLTASQNSIVCTFEITGTSGTNGSGSVCTKAPKITLY